MESKTTSIVIDQKSHEYFWVGDNPTEEQIERMRQRTIQLIGKRPKTLFGMPVVYPENGK